MLLETNAIRVILGVKHKEVIVVHHVLHVFAIVIVPAVHAPVIVLISALLLQVILFVMRHIVNGIADVGGLNSTLRLVSFELFPRGSLHAILALSWKWDLDNETILFILLEYLLIQITFDSGLKILYRSLFVYFARSCVCAI